MSRTRRRQIPSTSLGRGTYSPRKVAIVAQLLAKYHQASARKFPWRSGGTPYRLALAEILLQRTRAESILDTYTELLREYPAPADLGNARMVRLEAQLRHLGLSRKRARHLKRLGQTLSREGEGSLADPLVSMGFPGLGAYGARAVACFAFGFQTGIVDANVRRVLSRVFDLPKLEPRSRRYQELADLVAAAGPSPRAVNYGLLDLGALVCVREPRCEVCPLRKACAYASAHAMKQKRRTGGQNN